MVKKFTAIVVVALFTGLLAPTVLAATNETASEFLVPCAWVILGGLVVGTLCLGVQFCRSLQAAQVNAMDVCTKWHDAEAKATQYHDQLSVLQKRHLEELTAAVQSLLASLQERAAEMDEEDNWWKQGRQRGDEP